MNQKAFWITVSLLTLLWVAALTLGGIQAGAGSPHSRDLAHEQISAVFQGDDPDGAESWLEAGPSSPCPGWNLYYTLELTNTHSITPLTGLVVTDALPVGTWFAGEASGSLPVEYDAAHRVLTWRSEVITPGTGIVLYVTLRTYSSLKPGTHITNTFVYSASELARSGTVSGLSTVAHCSTATPQPTNTLTPTPTPTITATPKGPRVYLPVIFRRHQ